MKGLLKFNLICYNSNEQTLEMTYEARLYFWLNDHLEIRYLRQIFTWVDMLN